MSVVLDHEQGTKETPLDQTIYHVVVEKSETRTGMSGSLQSLLQHTHSYSSERARTHHMLLISTWVSMIVLARKMMLNPGLVVSPR